MGYVDQLYQEARKVRGEIEALWNEAQATDVAVKGAVSVAKTTGLSESERDFAGVPMPCTLLWPRRGSRPA